LSADQNIFYQEDKYHLTEFRISLQKLRHNLDHFESLLKPKTKFMLMIKANGYGHHSIALAKAFEEDDRVSYFSIAYTDEGIKLRSAGVRKSILVLNPSPNSFKAIIENCLEPEIHNLELLKSFIDFLKNNKEDGQPYPVHLKFNTGMNRLGFDPNELSEVINILKQQDQIRVQSMMTHLSSAHLESEDSFTQQQLQSFDEIIENSKEIQGEGCFFHALNSSGAFRFKDHQYQMVRLGIGLYGTSSIKELRESLQPAGKFVSHISQVRKVEKGASVSYSRSGRAKKDTQIATLSLGYADGFDRSLGNGKWHVEINGELYPTIGNICMGLCTIDIGDAELKIGDEVIIFGGKQSIYDYAKALDTITYEAMVTIGTRVKRVLSD